MKKLDPVVLAAFLLVQKAKVAPEEPEPEPEPEAEPEEDLVVSKALPIQKAWELDNGGVVVEGWISTEDRDIQNHVTATDAFTDALPDYMALGGPLTTEHQMMPNGRRLTRYPVGHVQKAALVRDGVPYLEAAHPTDPADFEHFPGKGTGVYARAVITDPLAASQVLQGNVRGFSWTGRASEYDPIPGGGKRLTRVSHLQETTVAAFPVNSKAAIVAAGRG